MSTLPISGQHEITGEVQSEFIQDELSTLPTHTESKCHIKWKRLADLPAPLHSVYTAIQGGKVYVTGGLSPFEYAEHQVFFYEIDSNRWGELPTPDHCLAIPHIINGKLTLIGGCLIPTYEYTNKVSTFDQTKQSWVSYYPNLLSVRTLPGVVTHMEHVIVAGGINDDAPLILEDIEILDWAKNAEWKHVSICLPVPMYYPQLTVCNDNIFVVGYVSTHCNFNKHVYELPVVVITNSADQQCASTRWVELGETTHLQSSVVTGLSSLMVVGGFDQEGTTEDIKIFENSTQKWKKIDSLSFARYNAAATAIRNNAMIVIGGCTSVHDRMSTSLSVVELGQVVQA